MLTVNIWTVSSLHDMGKWVRIRLVQRAEVMGPTITSSVNSLTGRMVWLYLYNHGRTVVVTTIHSQCWYYFREKVKHRF